MATSIALKQISSELAQVKKSIDAIRWVDTSYIIEDRMNYSKFRNKHLPLALEFLEKGFRQLESDFIPEVLSSVILLIMNNV